MLGNTRVLVTGATGFLGNYVVEELLKQNVEVVVSSSHTPAQPRNWYSKVSYFEFDILKTADFLREGGSLVEYFGNPLRVIHLAWRNSSQHQLPEHFEKELPAQYQFLTALIDEGVTDLTVAGTSFEYGYQTGGLREEAVPNPNTFYGLSKYSLLKALELYQKKRPFMLKWVRLFNTFGAGTQENTLLAQLRSAIECGQSAFNMSGGEQVRDFLPVDAAADYLVKICLQDEIDGVINCCSGKPKTVKAFVEEYLTENNLSIKLNLGYYPYRDYEPMAIWGNNEKLRKILTRIAINAHSS